MNSAIFPLSKTTGGRALAFLALFMTGLAQAELDYQFHGFAAQSFIYSEGNNFFGNSTKGSFEFYEAGANVTLSPLPSLLFSAQAVVRDAGDSDNDGLRLDYAFADYQFLGHEDAGAGLRAGRVKNQLGFYNDTRDVVFTRPGILLPQSVYFEGQGLRGLLFATNGVQAYAGFNAGDHYLSATATWGPDFNASKEDERILGGGLPLPGHVRISNFYLGRLQDELDSGALKFALSYMHGDVALVPNPGVPLSSSIDVDYYVLSGRYNTENFSLTSEYRLTTTQGSSFGAPLDNKSDGYYLQGDWRLTQPWSLMARYDATFSNRNDRNGREFAARTGGDRSSQYAHDLTLGAKWLYGAHWGVWGEYHFINGDATVPALDNVGRTLDSHWSIFLLMAAYRF